MPKPLLASCIIVLCVVRLTAQGSDFSGRWVLDEDQVHPAQHIPDRLVVRQLVAFTDSGTSQPAPYPVLIVNRRFGERVQEETYSIGMTLVGRNRVAVEWRGSFLWVERQSVSTAGAIVPERTEAWRLDDLGRLVITVTDRQGRDRATSETLAYRRDKL